MESSIRQDYDIVENRLYSGLGIVHLNSGGNHVSNRFLNSFWYLDQLGIASCYSTKVYCRQTLIGGNYGLLNTTTFALNPDYYSAVLWHRLMGKKVLAVSSDVHIKDFFL
eukprot:XP_025984540.1 heparanase-like protein 1 [Glycine max]